MPRCCARISLVERPIDNAIEEHGGGAGENHARDHKQKNPPRRRAIRCDDERAEREWQRENGVREPDEPEKADHGRTRHPWRAKWSSFNLRRHGVIDVIVRRPLS